MTTDAELFEVALATYFAEAGDMLQQIEVTLLKLENDPGDLESINALFRAAHTIKGSAGMFGLDRIVRFTHRVESVLDRVRNGELVIDTALSDILLKSSDVISVLLNQAEKKIESTEYLAELDHRSNAISARLEHYLGGSAAADKPVTEASIIGGASGTWHISLRFGEDTFRNGLDPLNAINYLETLGQIEQILTVVDNVPVFEGLDPESCFLGFEIRLYTAASKAEIETAFEFVIDDCKVRLFPPNRRASDFIGLMRELPDESRLGDLLVECGAVSRSGLDQALFHQREGGHDERRGQKPLGEILVEQKQVAHEVVDAALDKQRKIENRSEESRYVRVPADKLDELINLVGELVISGASASLIAKNLGEQQLMGATQHMSGLVEEIRNGTLGLRMVQIGESFARYRRVIRDTAAELGKEIKLDIEGAETELDKAVVEKISDPLMHLVRNAMDHGIEMPDVRVAAGKPARGTLLLEAHHDSGNIVIRVTDDGKGLDGEKLLAKARERGLVAPTQVLTEIEKLNLIFAPGFSTAETVTNLSGRGVGMDVVKKNIESLRGVVNLKSEVGKGTTIEIRLPLTLAIIDGFLVRIGRSSYVIPLHSVVECIDAEANDLHSNGDWAGHIDLRGEVLPVLELRSVFAVSEEISQRRSIVVVRNGPFCAGLMVDQLLGEYQTVIKPLGKLFEKLHGISGSTVMGSGEVALILDVPALIKLATDREARMEEQAVSKRAASG